MATEAQITRVRALTDETADDSIYLDDDLSSKVDTFGLEGAITEVWREKAARYAKLIDISESGSSRNLGQLYQNALRMVDLWSTSVAAAAGGRHSRTRPIVRP